MKRCCSPSLFHTSPLHDCLMFADFCPHNDDDDVLTMLVHVSHAWLGGGGLILIFNCYLHTIIIIIIIIADMMIATLWLPIFSLNYLTLSITQGLMTSLWFWTEELLTKFTAVGHLTHVSCKIWTQFILSLTSCWSIWWLCVGTGKSASAAAAYYLVFGWCLFLITCLDSRQITWITLLTKLVN